MTSDDESRVMMLAAFKGLDRFVGLMIQSGADVNRVDELGNTCLIGSTIFGHDKCLALLLKAGADVNIGNTLGLTALHYAAVDGYDKCERTYQRRS